MITNSASTLLDLRRRAIGLFHAGVAHANPASAVATALASREEAIERARRVILIAFGKAACTMAQAALPFVRHKIAGGCVVVNPENFVAIDGLLVLCGGHPLPDDGSLKAGFAVEEIAKKAGAGDLLLVLISGGGSALLSAPHGIEFEEKIKLNAELIRSGAPIGDINAVRQQLSRLKGGRLAGLAPDAHILSLILSDVPSDDPCLIASGPTAGPTVGTEEAINILRQYDLLDCCSPETRAHLEKGRGSRPGPLRENVENLIIGSNRMSVIQVSAAAKCHKLNVVTIDEWINGDVSEVAGMFHGRAKQASLCAAPTAIIAGGEPTVVVRGTGRGGRNQELALRFAMLHEQATSRPWVFLSGGTDGRDGPTDAAGAIVDRGTMDWIRSNGLDPNLMLQENDSYNALSASGDLLMTGPTGTNVADLHVFITL